MTGNESAATPGQPASCGYCEDDPDHPDPDNAGTCTCASPGCGRGWCPQRDDLLERGNSATPGQAARFRMKPITVEAVRWTGDNPGEVYELTGRENFDVLDEQDRANCDDPEATATVFARLHNSTWKLVHAGQWIVKGTKGEFFPLPDELFRGAYEPAAAREPHAAPELAQLRELLRLNRQLVVTLRRISHQQEDGGHAEAAYATGCAATMVEALWPVCNEQCTDTTHHHQAQPAPELASRRLILGLCPSHEGRVHAQILDEPFDGTEVWACLRALADIAEGKAAGITVQPATERPAPELGDVTADRDRYAEALQRIVDAVAAGDAAAVDKLARNALGLTRVRRPEPFRPAPGLADDRELREALAMAAAERNQLRIALERIAGYASGTATKQMIATTARRALDNLSGTQEPRPAPELAAERDGLRKALRAISLGIAEPPPKTVADNALDGRYFDPDTDSGVWRTSDLGTAWRLLDEARERLDAVRKLCEQRIAVVGMVDGKGVARKVIAIIDKPEGK